MKVSQLIEKLEEYREFYGDQPVSIWNWCSGEDLEIVFLDAFKNELSIHVGDIGSGGEDDE